MSDKQLPNKRRKIESKFKILSNNMSDDAESVMSVTREPQSLAEFLEAPRSFTPTGEFLNAYLPDDETVLTFCIKNQHEAAVEVLISCGADPNLPSRKGVTPISAAAHKGNVLIMQVLINAGATVNAVNSSGSTALIQASHFGHIEAVKLLLKHNASSDFANVKGTTALMRASQEGHVNISEELISAGVDVNRKNHEGMNALMLASQRGHADIVLLLIRAGATMDEQTSQGSTALMLACKRGHEKCAEVLVSMGAEIYMRDRRFRTAKDTATRRNHYGLLCWLDTQVQVSRIQEGRQKDRAKYIAELRKLHNLGKAHLNPTIMLLNDLTKAIKKSKIQSFLDLKSTEWSTNLTTKQKNLILQFSGLSNTPVQNPPQTLENPLAIVTRTPEQAIDLIAGLYSKEVNDNTISQALPVYPHSAKLNPRVPDCPDWTWALMFNRVFDMPEGVFEHIMEFMPSPRVWAWSLQRLRRRCKLAPLQAVMDISVIMDEILQDANIFAGSDQEYLLTKINRSPQIHQYLEERHGMSPALLHSLCGWADVQSLLMRHVEVDQQVSFRANLARKMLATAIELYRWFKHRCQPVKILNLTTMAASLSTTAVGNMAVGSMAVGVYSQVLRGKVNFLLEEEEDGELIENGEGEEGEDLMEATDAGGEEGSDFEAETGAPIDMDSDQDGVNDDLHGAGGGVANNAADMMVDDDILDDSDGDGPALGSIPTFP